jgi:hypothetical protein
MMPVALSIDEARTYLDAKPSWIILTTIGRDGYPHSVPIGYFRLGDDVYIGCVADTQKVKNVGRNPKVSLLVQSGSSMHDIKGLMIRGDATVFTEPDDVLRLGREAARVRGVPEDQLPTQGRPGAAYIRVALANMTSWDYSR